MAGASSAYEMAGVNLEAGDRASNKLYEAIKQTWVNRRATYGEPQTMSDGFRGVRGVSLGPLFELHESFPDIEFVDYHCSDGAGNKPKVAQRVGVHNTIFEDVAAMASDDATAQGGETISMTDVFVVNTLGKEDDRPAKKERFARYLSEIADGIVSSARKGNFVFENGETAEHGEGVDGYGEFRYDISGTAHWLGMRERLLDGSRIKPGAAVVALADKGFGCNGYSLLLKTLEQEFGYEWHHQPFGENSTWGLELLRPSEIYSGLFTELTGGYRPDVDAAAEVQGIIHVTGGGIFGKAGSRLRGTNCGLVLDNLLRPSAAMAEFQNMADIDDQEMMHVFHGGQRGLVITTTPEKVIELSLARGIHADIAGEVTNTPEITVYSRLRERGKKITEPIVA